VKVNEIYILYLAFVCGMSYFKRNLLKNSHCEVGVIADQDVSRLNMPDSCKCTPPEYHI
jgi:hypothetical protein